MANNNEYFYYTSESENTEISSGNGNVATAADTLEDYIIKDAVTREIIEGSMPFNQASTTEIAAGKSYTIPKGYHTGEGKVIAKDLASQTVGSATAADIVSGRIAVVNGVTIVGILNVVTATESDATITADKVLNGYIGYNKGTKVTGNVTINTSSIQELSPGSIYTIPKGYHDGTGKLTVKSLAELTPATASASSILNGSTAYVNGVLITGTLKTQDIIDAAMSTTDIDRSDVLYGKKFYHKTEKNVVAGTVPTYYNESEIELGQTTYTLPVGYHDGTLKIHAKSLAELTADATATPNLLVNGATAYVAGVKITGTMPIIEATTIYLNSGETYTIPLGYHNGNGRVVVN